MARKYFGTDGIRGRVGEFPITPEFILKLGWAAGRVLGGNERGKVVIGKDTRLSGYMFESALESGLSAAGMDVLLLGPMPTPGIAYLTRTLGAVAGIVISASHNPFEDNGIKFFSAEGTKLPDAVEEEIERLIDEPLTMATAGLLGRAKRINDAAGRYIEFCKSSVPFGLNLRGMKLVVDCANGATYHVAPAVFAELGAEVVTTGDHPDGLNINVECGSTHPETLTQRVRQEGADLGIALDGDGDRLIMVDGEGEVVDGDELLYIIATDRQRDGGIEGVVGTVMTNLGMENALKEAGIGFARAKVGDRYVIEQMLERGWRLGGESSGHLISLDHTTTGDGIISALQVLHALVRSGKPLHELKRGMSKYPQRMINVRLRNGFQIQGSQPISDAVAAVEADLGSRGRVLLRPSGTEPVVRVMVEGEELSEVVRFAEELAQVVEKAMQ